MLPSAQLYPLVVLWLQALGVAPHATGLAALAWVVTATLLAQSLRPSALARALLSPTDGLARGGYARVARTWSRRWLSPAWLTPCLLRAALALVDPDPAGWPTAGLTHLALDTVRLGRWEVFVLGVVWQGRVLPVAWRARPYPLPKGVFTPTACALLRQVAGAWPAGADRPAHLLADRGFPSHELFRTLRQLGWHWTVRLRARGTLAVDGQPRPLRALLATASTARWTTWGAGYGQGAKAIPGTLAIGRGLRVLPRHQRDAASLGHQARRRAQRLRDLAAKHPGRGPATTPDLEAWVLLFSSLPTWRAAATGYRRRWPVEGTFRDAQGGWDGAHGWHLDRAVARRDDGPAVEAIVGLWAPATLLQSWIGHQTAQPDAPTPVQRVVGQWTTTGRLSLLARGRFALTEPNGRLRHWLVPALTAGAQQVAAAPPPRARPRLVPPGAPASPAAQPPRRAGAAA
jgi:hypothetical protein